MTYYLVGRKRLTKLTKIMVYDGECDKLDFYVRKKDKSECRSHKDLMCIRNI